MTERIRFAEPGEDVWAEVRAVKFTPDERRGEYRVLIIKVAGREVQLCASPTGRSLQVHVDGERVS